MKKGLTRGALAAIAVASLCVAGIASAEVIYRHNIQGGVARLPVTPDDGEPDAFTIAAVTGVEPSTLVQSEAVVLHGHNKPVPVSVMGDGSPLISVAGGPWGASGTVLPGQAFRVRLTASSAFADQASAWVTAGSAAAQFAVTTRAADMAPDAFSIAAANGVARNSLVESQSVTLSGFTDPAPVSVSGAGSPQVSIAGGAWGSNGTILPGQSLKVRLTSSGGYSATHQATVTVGGVSAVFSVTTGAAPALPGSSPSYPASSCAQAMSAHGVASGVFWIKEWTSDETGTYERLFQAYCPMNDGCPSCGDM